MKKIIRSVCLLFALLFIFTACKSDKHVHEYGKWYVTAPAACLPGEEKRVCSCGAEQYFCVPATGEHDFKLKAEKDAYLCKPATCQSPAIFYYKCTTCSAMSAETYEVSRPWAHTYKDGVCTLCNRVQGYERDGNIIKFGTYPQTRVTNSTLVTKLNTEAGTLPKNGAPQKWTGYGYYYSGEAQEYMWYIDVTEGNDKYRGVYFTSYRSEWSGGKSSSEKSNQDDNGYKVNTVYWFKYEPITWTILCESNGRAELLCNMVIDAQPFYTSTAERTQDQKTVYANNYEHSTVRKWLNETFYQTAFGEYQQQIIPKVLATNSTYTAGEDTYKYVCNSTEDKVFLLSYSDVTNGDYGFKTSGDEGDTFRIKKPTDYAQAQGINTDRNGSSGAKMVGWWMRSPSISSGTAQYCTHDGRISRTGQVVYCGGIVPVIWIQLG